MIEMEHPDCPSCGANNWIHDYGFTGDQNELDKYIFYYCGECGEKLHVDKAKMRALLANPKKFKKVLKQTNGASHKHLVDKFLSRLFSKDKGATNA